MIYLPTSLKRYYLESMLTCWCLEKIKDSRICPFSIPFETLLKGLFQASETTVLPFCWDRVLAAKLTLSDLRLQCVADPISGIVVDLPTDTKTSGLRLGNPPILPRGSSCTMVWPDKVTCALQKSL